MVVVTRFGRLLRQLLPPGTLYTEDPASVLQRTLNGLGGELERADVAAAELPRDLDPARGTSSIPDWERVLGLPDECGPAPTTLDGRRGAILGRLLSGGFLSRKTYIDLARALGYTIAIQEGTSDPFRVGADRCGESLGTDGGVFEWIVRVFGGSTQSFRCGLNACGDPLSVTGDELLECVIRRASPAHTGVRFAYEDVGECWLDVGDGEGGLIRIFTIDGRFYFIDEFGSLIPINTTDKVIRVLDEFGNHMTLELQGP